VRPLVPKWGDLPAINATPVGESLNILSLSSGPFSVSYTDKAELVRSEGIDWPVVEHRRILL
jgi:hypothetical protein